MGKVENFDKIREWIKSLKTNSFTSFQVEKEFELTYNQVKPILGGIEELGEIKYLTSNKLYVRL